MGRMGIEQPDPEIARDRLNPLQQSGKRGAQRGIDRLLRAGFLVPKIHPVVVRILTDEIDLLNTLRHKMTHLGFNRFHRPAAMPSAHLRDNTKTAWMIASFGDLQIRKMRGCKPEMWRR